MLGDMKVYAVGYNGHWENGSPDGDPHHKDSDWSKIQEVCCFSHKDACEFIVYLGEDPQSIKWSLEAFNKKGLSEEFVLKCIEAIQNGYRYICFYD